MTQNQPPEFDDLPDSPSVPSEQQPAPTSNAPRSGLIGQGVTPTVTYILLGLTIFAFLIQYVSEWTYKVDVAALYGMKINELIEGGQVWRLITPVFLHASILHIGFNMYALYVFGPGMERVYGHGRFLALYLLSAFAGNVLSFMLSPVPSLGASTAIFGLLAAEAVFLYQNRAVIQSAQRMLINLITIAAINLFIGLAPGMRIDNWGHLGGLFGGLIFAWFGGPMLEITGYPERTLVDRRTPVQVQRAGLAVFAIFAFLGLVEILF